MPLLKEEIQNRREARAEDYWNLPDGERAELIEGQLYNMTPPSRTHQAVIAELVTEFKLHIRKNGGTCEVYPAPFAVNLDAEDKNWVEPDISVICDPCKLTDSGCCGAPDLIVEVLSPSTRSRDGLIKLNLYQKYGVREYWIVNPETRQVYVYNFVKSEFNLYTFDEKVPVGIWDGALEIQLASLVGRS